MDKQATMQKKASLIKCLRGLDSILIAFSGGVDSTFLLAVAWEVLGEKVLAATAQSIITPSKEKNEPQEFIAEKGIRHITFQFDALEIPKFRENNPDRCYHCKKYMAQILIEIAKEQKISTIAHGANVDDLGDYRPGHKAAEEMGIVSPLIEVGLTKEEIRYLSREMGLSTWNKPSMACLASRIPYSDIISEDKLAMIDRAESWLFEQGFCQCRLRHHGEIARIEVESSSIDKFLEAGFRNRVVDKLREIGFSHIVLDLEGYVMGSMNRNIK